MTQNYSGTRLHYYMCVCVFVCVFRFKRMENPFHEGQKTKVVEDRGRRPHYIIMRSSTTLVFCPS
jgi:hypothetical protein